MKQSEGLAVNAASRTTANGTGGGTAPASFCKPDARSSIRKSLFRNRASQIASDRDGRDHRPIQDWASIAAFGVRNVCSRHGPHSFHVRSATHGVGFRSFPIHVKTSSEERKALFSITSKNPASSACHAYVILVPYRESKLCAKSTLVIYSLSRPILLLRSRAVRLPKSWSTQAALPRRVWMQSR